MTPDERDEDVGGLRRRDARRRFSDFDCPECSANNPWDESFGDGDEVRCHYCGEELRVLVTEGGRLRLKSI
jgi:DNA-directed RNA polymerase subunit RPC12/RpoP